MQYETRKKFDPSGRLRSAFDPRGGAAAVRAEQRNRAQTRSAADRLATKFNKKGSTADDIINREQRLKDLASAKHDAEKNGTGSQGAGGGFLSNMFGTDDVKAAEDLATADLLEKSGVEAGQRLPAFLKVFSRREIADVAEAGMDVLRRKAYDREDAGRLVGSGNMDPITAEPLMLYGQKEPRDERLMRYAALRSMPSRRQQLPNLYELAEVMDGIKAMPNLVYVLKEVVDSLQDNALSVPETVQLLKICTQLMVEDRGGTFTFDPNVLNTIRGTAPPGRKPAARRWEAKPSGGDKKVQSADAAGGKREKEHHHHHHHHHHDDVDTDLDDSKRRDPDPPPRKLESVKSERPHYHHHPAAASTFARRGSVQARLQTENKFRSPKRSTAEQLHRGARLKEEMEEDEEEVVRPEEKESRPYLMQNMIRTRNLARLGIYVWSVPEEEGLEVLKSSRLSIGEKLRQVLNFDLNWSHFPRVRVAEVGRGPSIRPGYHRPPPGGNRMQKNFPVMEGDVLLGCNGESISGLLLSQDAKSKDPNEVLVSELQRRWTSFAFLQSEATRQYVQLTLTSRVLGVEFRQATSKIANVNPKSFAARHGLQIGDELVMVNDLLCETNRDEALSLLTWGERVRPLDLLFRRASGFPHSVRFYEENNFEERLGVDVNALGPSSSGRSGGKRVVVGETTGAMRDDKVPFLLSQLLQSRNPSAYGITFYSPDTSEHGNRQASIEDPNLTSTQKMMSTLGFTLDWVSFPRVYVSNSKRSDAPVGSLLLLCCGDRVTMVATWKGRHADEAVLRKVHKADGGDVSFAFLRMPGQYLQVTTRNVGVIDEKSLSIEVKTGKVISVKNDLARAMGIAAGDELVTVDDLLFEKQPSHALDHMYAGSSSQLLFRRRGGFPPDVLNEQEAAVRRPLPAGWAEEAQKRRNAAPKSPVSVATVDVNRDDKPGQPAKPVAAIGTAPASPVPVVKPASPAPVAAPVPTTARTSPDAPYCVQFLGFGKNLPGAGLAGWGQSSIDDKILKDDTLSNEEKMLKLFGVKLDWSKFPVVTVTTVEPKMPDDSGPSRAAKNGIVEGDMLIMAATLQDRVTTVPTWEGKDPNDALMKKIRRKFERQDNPVAAFVFFRKKKEKQYVQLEAKDKQLGFTVDTSNKIVSVSSGGWADQRGLKAGDLVAVAGDALSEKQPDEVTKRVADSGPRPIHLLFRRETEFTESTLSKAVDVSRILPTAWQTALGINKITAAAVVKPAPPATTPAAKVVPAPAAAPKPAAPAQPAPAAPKTARTGPDPPYCAQFLGFSKDLMGAGMAGWAQSSIDDKILKDASIPADDKILQLFGMKLDWSTYPQVAVTKVDPMLPDKSGPSRAGKNGIVEGDQLIMLGTLQDRLTTVVTWPGSSPADALIQKVQRKFGRGDNPVAAFAFLRKKKMAQYVQLEATEKSLGISLDTKGKIDRVAPGSWAAKQGIEGGDVVAVAGDVLTEKDGPEVQKRVSDGGTRPLHILFRRQTEFPATVLQQAVDVSRNLPPNWISKEPAAGAAGKAAAPPTAVVKPPAPSSAKPAAGKKPAGPPPGAPAPAAGKKAAPPTAAPKKAPPAAALQPAPAGKKAPPSTAGKTAPPAKAAAAATPAPPAPAAPAAVANKPDPPYCAQFLGFSKKLVEMGLAGWAQSSIDGIVLNDGLAPAPKKIADLFGVKLDWSGYPIVKVTEVVPTMPDGTTPSRAAKNGVFPGDMLVMVGTLQDRVTTVATWEGKTPSDAIVKKYQRKYGRKDNPVAAFAFLRAKKANQYVQLEAQEKTLGITVADDCAITAIAAGSWAAKQGLKPGDKVVVAGDALAERQADDVKTRVADGGPRPMHFLFRRETEFDAETLKKGVDVKRNKPPNWDKLE
ncbi:unnamed protein product [Amoebophrya sp. A120]|nr:unnamed protein product [Amoebophrya sp. A120]|eukprot:GSA120T00003039001.1